MSMAEREKKPMKKQLIENNWNEDGTYKSARVLYKEFLEGYRRTLPKNYWTSLTNEEIIDRLRQCIDSYKEFHGLSENDIVNKVRFPNLFFTEMSLKRLYHDLRDRDLTITTILGLFPNNDPWEVGITNVNLFKEKDQLLKAFKWFITDVMKLRNRRAVMRNMEIPKRLISFGWKDLPLIYLEFPDDYIFKFDMDLAVAEMIMDAFPEWFEHESELKLAEKHWERAKHVNHFKKPRKSKKGL